jgi:hypothetical protein
MQYRVLFIILSVFLGFANGASYNVRGKAVNGLGIPLKDVKVSLIGKNATTLTDSVGYFFLTDNTHVVPIRACAKEKYYFSPPFLFINNSLPNSVLRLDIFNAKGQGVRHAENALSAVKNQRIDLRRYGKCLSSGIYYFNFRMDADILLFKAICAQNHIMISGMNVGSFSGKVPALEKTSSVVCKDTLLLSKEAYKTILMTLANCDTMFDSIKVYRGGVSLLQPKGGEIFRTFDTVRAVVDMFPEDNYIIKLAWRFDDYYNINNQAWQKIPNSWPEIPGNNTVCFIIPRQVLFPSFTFPQTTVSKSCRLRAYVAGNDSIYSEMKFGNYLSIVPEDPRVNVFRINTTEFPGYNVGNYATYLGWEYFNRIDGGAEIYIEHGYREVSDQIITNSLNQNVEIRVLDFGPGSDSANSFFNLLNKNISSTGGQKAKFAEFSTDTAVFYSSSGIGTYQSLAWFGKFCVLMYLSYTTDSQTAFENARQLMLILKSKFDQSQRI